ncbi:MAG: hypothetical protein ACK53K_08950 [Burkholderiales bacterium]
MEKLLILMAGSKWADGRLSGPFWPHADNDTATHQPASKPAHLTALRRLICGKQAKLNFLIMLNRSAYVFQFD